MNADFLRRLSPRPGPLPTEAQHQSAERARHEAAEREALPSRMREWGIPRPDREAILAGDPGSHITAALQHVRQFHRGGRDWALVLWGGYRVGKTYAALRWLVEAAEVPFETLDLGPTYRYATTARFMPFAALAEAAGSFREHHQALITEAITARALVLDDVGAQGRSAAPILDQVISARHLHRRATLITTNLGRELFGRADHYGLRVTLRLEEGGAFRGCGKDPSPDPSPKGGGGSSPAVFAKGRSQSTREELSPPPLGEGSGEGS